MFAHSRIAPRTIVVAAVLALLAPLIAALPAQAATVTCGEPITARTVTLDADLICEGDALIVGANNVTIDLAGHTVRSGDGDHVLLIEGYNRVTIRNGELDVAFSRATVRDTANTVLSDLSFTGCCPSDLMVTDATRLTVEDSSFNDTGLLLRGVRNGVIRDNDLTNHNSGPMTLEDSDNNLIEGNTFQRNLGTAIDVSGDRNTLRTNIVTRNFVGIWVREGAGNRLDANVVTIADFGIRVEAEAVRTVLDGNTSSDSRNPATSERPGDGIHIANPTTTLRDNHAFDNASWGIWAVPGVRDRGGNTASGNTAGQCLNVDCS